MPFSSTSLTCFSEFDLEMLRSHYLFSFIFSIYLFCYSVFSVARLQNWKLFFSLLLFYSFFFFGVENGYETIYTSVLWNFVSRFLPLSLSHQFPAKENQRNFSVCFKLDVGIPGRNLIFKSLFPTPSSTFQ